MEFDGRSLLLGAGLFGMVIGATVGLVAGGALRDCADAFFGEERGVCNGYDGLRTASFVLVGFCALVAGGAVYSAAREQGGFRVTWRR